MASFLPSIVCFSQFALVLALSCSHAFYFSSSSSIFVNVCPLYFSPVVPRDATPRFSSFSPNPPSLHFLCQLLFRNFLLLIQSFLTREFHLRALSPLDKLCLFVGILFLTGNDLSLSPFFRTEVKCLFFNYIPPFIFNLSIHKILYLSTLSLFVCRNWTRIILCLLNLRLIIKP